MVQVSTGESQLESRNQRALKRESGLFSSPARGRFHAREHGTEATRNYDLIILSVINNFQSKNCPGRAHRPARGHAAYFQTSSLSERAAAGLGLGGGVSDHFHFHCT